VLVLNWMRKVPRRPGTVKCLWDRGTKKGRALPELLLSCRKRRQNLRRRNPGNVLRAIVGDLSHPPKNLVLVEAGHSALRDYLIAVDIDGNNVVRSHRVNDGGVPVVDGLDVEIVKIDQDEVGFLADFQGADIAVEAEGFGAAQRRRAHRLPGGDDIAPAFPDLLHLGEEVEHALHVHAVAREGAVGGEPQGDARGLKARRGADETAGFGVGSRAVGDPQASLSGQVDIGIVQVEHVDRQKTGGEEAGNGVQIAQDRAAEPGEFLVLEIHFRHVHHNFDIELFGFPDYLSQVFRVHGVGSVGGEAGLDAGMAVPVPDEISGIVDAAVTFGGVGRRVAEDGLAENGPQARFVRGLGDLVLEIVHVGEGGRARSSHFREAVKGGPVGEVPGHQVSFQREDHLGETVGNVLAGAAEGGHGDMGMGVDHAGHEESPRRLDAPLRRPEPAFGGGPEGGDPPVFHRDIAGG